MFNEIQKKMKKRNLFLSTALMCGFFTIAFSFDSNGIYWLWSDNKLVAVVLAIASLTLGVLWFNTSKRIKAEG